MPIAVTENGVPFYGAGFPVRFFRTDGMDWVGNFARGATSFNAVFSLRDSENILVIAGGISYIMHPDKTTPVEAFDEDYDKAFPLENGRIVLQGNCRFCIVEPDSSHWHTDAIYFWDFKDVRVQDNIITGQAVAYNNYCDDVEFVAFTYNIDTKTLIRE
jgi:hypothetical protein